VPTLFWKGSEETGCQWLMCPSHYEQFLAWVFLSLGVTLPPHLWPV
jgi:hypothetical protein